MYICILYCILDMNAYIYIYIYIYIHIYIYTHIWLFRGVLQNHSTTLVDVDNLSNAVIQEPANPNFRQQQSAHSTL